MTLSQAIDQEPGFATLQLHSGERPGSGVSPRATPIYLTAGFVLEDFDQAADLFENGDGYTYTRVANPTAEAVEQKVALLERGAEADAGIAVLDPVQGPDADPGALGQLGLTPATPTPTDADPLTKEFDGLERVAGVGTRIGSHDRPYPTD